MFSNHLRNRVTVMTTPAIISHFERRLHKMWNFILFFTNLIFKFNLKKKNPPMLNYGEFQNGSSRALAPDTYTGLQFSDLPLQQPTAG